MNMKALLGTLAALVVLFGGSFGAVEVADQRYAPMSEFQDLHWANLRAQIRELEDDIRNEASRDRHAELKRDLEDLLDVFCRRYPEDRYCDG